MHELSITESILDIALRHAKDAQASKITDIYLVIGQLSSVVDNSVQFYWDIISNDTLAEGSKLHFKRIPTEMQCQDCKNLYRPSENEFACPNCHSMNIKIISGNEFYLESIGVEN
jgi:hydrogenase nickel incorporation protein HypA/HybF